MTEKSLAPFHRNRSRLPRKQRQHEASSKANRQLVKKNPPSSSGGTYLRISSLKTFTQNGSKLNNYESRDSSKPNFSSQESLTRLINLTESAILLRSPPSIGLTTVSLLPRKIGLLSLSCSRISLDPCHPICATRGVITPPLCLSDLFEAQAFE
ncbi:unnamed protein product [Protopolystoma xenopodis]|uniref:Uncharacterized protein n=1 Tax=Protopolystoma xenopodis TaxID=117903 RepID=A0A3S5AVY2_9PLAT|nr:unnamed protein product [Protopolystoma xenopodis]